MITRLSREESLELLRAARVARLGCVAGAHRLDLAAGQRVDEDAVAP